MANANTSTSVISSESLEQRGVHFTNSNMNIVQPPSSQHGRISADGPVGILWDIENCPVPSDVRPEDVAGNIRMALRVHPVIKGSVTTFSAYGDFNAFPRRLREGCQRTGVKLVDVPNGRKDAADKAILVDMFLFALDNPLPSSIVLISGDVDFAPALHILGQRGYTVILVIPSGVGVSSALSSAGKFVWDWPSVARGEGFVPPTKPSFPPRSGPVDIAGYLMGCHISDNFDGQNEGISQSYCNTRDFSMVSHSLSEYNSSSSIAMPCFPSTLRSQSLPSGLNEVSAGPISSVDKLETIMWVQPGDMNGLKTQLVKLLELSGGCLPLNRVPSEYQKFFGRPLYVSEYGVFKLVNLFKKMSDALAIDGKGKKKCVYLRNWKAGPSAPPLPLARKVKGGERAQEECIDVIGNGSSDEFSDEERVMIEEHDETRNQGSFNMGAAARSKIDDHDLGQFKLELQEILVSYSCRIFLGCFEAVYQQRYKRPLDYQKFGVDQLEELFEKMRDIVVLHEEPVTKRKFLEAVGG
ncbi:Endonuclease or glycosyl hydrolase [Tripterygium wilfordii]|uniref:Endonuclease or glycosyl hydrolase n=1 Tax=Tripterygium wilfordii TaxID=458696 RepID=A0A7J7C066_TRIWF|nr:uncharacterized protein LOC119991206 [Tripterygium wilfordii]XP_038693403.1 uncharacterized protein LOC119991206 [Tripterygium wilfordii]XP_038693404.1 uncharacterized protein LOC119991206 [Tripterygium wilfordii]KAF5727257.1 Endonuclease or glycosyl hydrolase [Tripterygium wilfordii]